MCQKNLEAEVHRSTLTNNLLLLARPATLLNTKSRILIKRLSSSNL